MEFFTLIHTEQSQDQPIKPYVSISNELSSTDTEMTIQQEVTEYDGLAILFSAIREVEKNDFGSGKLKVPKMTKPMASTGAVLSRENYRNFLVGKKGSSRHSPYGMRFVAEMRDGTIRESHIAGDLAERARVKNSRGARVDLALIIHEGELQQLESAYTFYNETCAAGYVRPSASEVIDHLQSNGLDIDYRKGNGATLSRRNAGNFYKRLQDYVRKRHGEEGNFGDESNQTAVDNYNEED